MDSTTSRLVDFVARARFTDVSADAVHECKRRLVDTFACAVGAYNDPLSQMARAVAKRYSYTSPAKQPAASVWGCSWKSAPEMAAFANGVMLRLLDISDMYRVKSGGHPSDVIAAVLAAGESVRADGRAVVNAVILAYEVYCGFCDAININEKGWDQPVYSALACAMGAGDLLKLSDLQMGHAIALALVPNMSLFQTREGELSSWKNCAAANASRNGIFAAMLAKDGFTGPAAAFEGKGGLWDIVGRFDWQMPEAVEPLQHAVGRTHMKCFPVCYHGQSAISAVLGMRSGLDVSAIADIEVKTYKMAVEVMGLDP